MEKVVILIIAHKPELNIYEQISLSQCYKVLGNHPIKIICPNGLDVSSYKNILPDPQFDFIDPMWQSTYANFNRLKIEPFLYLRYSKYQFILFYEPDAFVFHDELVDWCNEGYDYIGAPWFDGFCDANENSNIIGIGNGGFSLRKVKKSLKILKQLKVMEILNQYSDFNIRLQIMNILKILSQWINERDELAEYVKNYKEYEDLFWGVKIQDQIDNFKKNRYLLSILYNKLLLKDYNLAPVEKAIEFSFENLPDKLYNLNSNKLPFGCHAWFKYNYKFWKPFITEFGYDLP